MGFVHVNVGLSNPSEPDRAEEVNVLVDTGATLSVFPAGLLDRLGIRRTGSGGCEVLAASSRGPLERSF